jgi:hypothetical protein
MEREGVVHNPRVGWDVDFMKAAGVVDPVGTEKNAKLA